MNITKDKVYLNPGEKPPEGVNVQQGPEGGHFYESNSVKPVQPHPMGQKPANEPEKQNIKNQRIQEAVANHIKLGDRLYEKFGQEGVELQKKLMFNWLSDSSSYWGSMTRKALSEVFKKDILFIDSASVTSGRFQSQMAKHEELFYKELGPDVRDKTKFWEYFKAIAKETYEFSQEILKQKYPSGKVTLYRGVDSEFTREYLQDKPTGTLMTNTGESWTNDLDSATFFVYGKGSIMKAEFPIETVFNSHLTDRDLAGADEYEFILLGTKVPYKAAIRTWEEYQDKPMKEFKERAQSELEKGDIMRILSQKYHVDIIPSIIVISPPRKRR